VGPPRPDGLHPLASLLASIDLADELTLEESGKEDVVVCPGVESDNLALRALAAFRQTPAGRELAPLRVEIDKRVPVAAGLGGGSADAAAVLRAANELAGHPLTTTELRALGATVGSDVPALVEHRQLLVTGVGEVVEPVGLPPLELVLVPAAEGLLTRDVYAQFDRAGGGRAALDAARLRELAAQPAAELAAALENDLQPAALALRPELERTLGELLEAEALGVAVSGSGPTVFGVFEDRQAADRAVASLPGAIATRTRGPGR